MKKFALYFLSFVLFLLLSNCKQQEKKTEAIEQHGRTAAIKYAKGFTLDTYEGVYVVRVNQPWINAKEHYTYILKKKEAQVPDSLQIYPQIQIPIQTIVCTSTTHLPALDVLGEVASLTGFAGLNYTSTATVRKQIDLGRIRELGQSESLNVEVVLDLQPTVVMAFAMDKNNKALQTIQNAGIPIIFNGDWTEQNPLGKAEWIKLFGALYDKEKEANQIFNQIEIDYQTALQLVLEIEEKPTVLSGVMYSDIWYLPEGKSWAAVYFKDAKTNYLWQETQGTGSLSLSFEQVLEKAKQAEYWINPGHYESLSDLVDANPHYKEFDAFKNKKVYSFAPVKGPTGGSLFYELGSLRPDLVLKDLIKIVHPAVLPTYQPYFYRQLQ